MNKLEFKYTFKEFFEGSRNASSVFKMTSLLGGILILYTLYALFKPGAEGAGNSPFVLGLGVVWVSLPLLQAWMVWRSNSSVRSVISCWADEDGFSQQTTNSDLTVKWPALVKFKETRNLFLVYPSKQMCYLIPKRAFTDESQVREFRELLDRKINKRQ